MSDEEDSMTEGFSASEDEWKPSKNTRGGESSDDDDSDFEDEPITGIGAASNAAPSRKREPKGQSSSSKQAAAAKKRKPIGQSLRTKLYNKYRPIPRTVSSPSRAANNSPSASTSRTASKNARAPNDNSEPHDNDSSSESSVEDYLVNPADLDLQSSFFDINSAKKSPAPTFDCNAGIAKLSDSGSEDNNESSVEERAKDTNVFDFRNLLENANSLERAKETIAKRAAAIKTEPEFTTMDGNIAAMDVNSLLALGENKNNTSIDRNMAEDAALESGGAQKLSKTKSTRVKRHTKTRPTSAVITIDTDDSDWEDVADGGDDSLNDDSGLATHPNNDVVVHVELASRKRSSKDQKRQDLEMALRRRLNRDMKERQLMLHKTSLLCWFGRSYAYNRLLNDTTLMQAALKMLPSKNSYPPDRGTEVKYYQSLMTWYKTAIKLKSENLYAEKTKKVSKRQVKKGLLEQIESKAASCKQDMVLIFVILMRGMGLQCRLVVNMQPLPLRPAQSDLLIIKKVDTKPKQTKASVEKVEVNVEKSTEAASTKKSNLVKEKIAETKKDVSSDEKSKVSKEGLKKLAAIKEKIKEDLAETRGRKRKEGDGSKSKDMLATTHVKEEQLEPVVLLNKTMKEECPRVSNSRSSSSTKRGPNLNTSKKEDQHDDNKKSQKAHTKKLPVEENSSTKKVLPAVQKPETSQPYKKPALSKLKRAQTAPNETAKEPQLSAAQTVEPAKKTRKSLTPVVPQIVVQSADTISQPAISNGVAQSSNEARVTRSRSKSPKALISPVFLQSKTYKERFSPEPEDPLAASKKAKSEAAKNAKVRISAEFLKSPQKVTAAAVVTRSLRSRQKANETEDASKLNVPQLDGADDVVVEKTKSKRPQLKKLQKTRSTEESDEDFEPSPSKRPKQAPVLPKAVNELRKDRRVLSTDDEKESKRNSTAADVWAEVWSDMEQQWICVDLFKGKLHSVESNRKSASSSLAYVFAFQNDLSIKDVTARYCPHWTSTVRKSRIDRNWLDVAIAPYLGRRTMRDVREDEELRRIHEEKPMPTAIGDYKDHPLYVLERHLLKFQALYPPDAPTLGFIRGEPVYSRDCVYTLHSREIWLKSARTVKLGEQPYKIVKARPKWDRLTQTVIKDQPLEIFGIWQTQDYEPPTAENGMVPRNAYGNVELFKACMLPKKTVHMKLPGLNRVCRKIGVDCANAVIGFDFHQGACHPTYDGFVVCEEFEAQVTAAWYKDQEEQDRKEQEKHDARVFGNWKRLIRGLLIRERLKKKYNF